ncbi:MAG: hypothetical protein COB20_04345 [SAR86 cluster bacterium]|uniref:Phosphatidic acid phosphatase type 2/haloperoxidase domain-containing protein n=1 Tax=SAR86 cluster bacterium TaxID=2030880 RepID=A0A2A4XCB9_9GAMM|nr:MAG: hypothetical protein COB20_04345 [SAR86 cluster bacterium]
MSLFSLLLVVLLSTGCASNSTSRAGWSDVRQAASEAFMDRSTWLPLVAAGVFAMNDYDEQVTEWASEKTPLFGSTKRADDGSDRLSQLSHVTLAVSAMPSISSLKEDGMWKSATATFKRLRPALGAHLVNIAFTQTSKDHINRERPDGEGSESFPSGHTSYSVVSAIQASNLIDRMDIPQATKRNLRLANYSVAGLSAWARLEANRHYPSDVLTSFAVGNFAAGFVNRLLEKKMNDRNELLFLDTNGNTGIRLTYAYAW